MTDLQAKKLPNFDLSAFDLPNLTDSFLTDEKSVQMPGEKFIVFVLDGELFAVSAKKVAEVVQPLPLTPLPNVPEWLLGIANLRSSIISVVNLLKLWDKKTSPVSSKTKFIVLRSPNDVSSIAFTVDKLSEVVTLPNEKIQFIEDDKTPFFYAKAIHKTNTLNLINVENLLKVLNAEC
ncbi:MAG: chemotaxis protein CheW [Acidobacteriota bacterium]|nr:chemotaxis protein CheW [Acidobacteriota bacterium]